MPYKNAVDYRQWIQARPGYHSKLRQLNKERYADYELNRDPVKVRARKMVNNAVRLGELIRPDSCDNCGQLVKVVGHHPDYTKPLEVEWVCVDCHRNIKH